MANTLKSNLDLVNECDSFPYYHSSPEIYEEYLNKYHQFKIRLDDVETIIGYIPNSIAENLPVTDVWARDSKRKTFTIVIGKEDDAEQDEKRNVDLASYLQRLRHQKIFKVLDGWRDEVYPIYGTGRRLVLNMERSATPLFGVVTYGVHMTAYVNTAEGLKIWAPRRADTKQTYPGMMDNTVAGGVSTGEKPFDCLIREAQEEASLPEDISRNAKACGTLTYFHVRDGRAGGETGLCQPECQYLYDLELESTIIPRPGDNEAVDFRLLSLAEVRSTIARGLWKPNCVLVVLDFLIRHGILTPENEPDYIEIVARLHRRIEFPTM